MISESGLQDEEELIRRKARKGFPSRRNSLRRGPDKRDNVLSSRNQNPVPWAASFCLKWTLYSGGPSLPFLANALGGPGSLSQSFAVFFFKIFICSFLERGEGREKEREININVWLPLVRPQPRTWPATQACALTGNRTSNLVVCKPALNPLSHTNQGMFIFFRRASKLCKLQALDNLGPPLLLLAL